MRMKRKGEISLGMLAGIIVTLTVVGLLATFGGQITTDVHDQYDTLTQNTSAAFNVSQGVEAGLVNVSDQFGNVGTVVGAAVIIGILMTVFVVKMGGVNFTR